MQAHMTPRHSVAHTDLAPRPAGSLARQRTHTIGAFFTKNKFILLTVGVVVALCIACAALGMAIHQKASTSFSTVTTKHLIIKADKDNSEAISIEFEGNDSDYPANAAGVRINMPRAAGQGSTAQAGVKVTGGQFALDADAPVTAGVVVSQPNDWAIQVKGGTSGNLIGSGTRGSTSIL